MNLYNHQILLILSLFKIAKTGLQASLVSFFSFYHGANQRYPVCFVCTMDYIVYFYMYMFYYFTHLIAIPNSLGVSTLSMSSNSLSKKDEVSRVLEFI